MALAIPSRSGLPARGAGLDRALLDAVADAVVGTDGAGRIIHWNDAAEDLFGWTAAEVLGRSLRDGVLPSSLPGVHELEEAMQAGRTWSGTIVAKRRDGRFLPSELHCGPLRGHDGSVVGMVAVAKDVTDQLATEAALRDNEERFRTVFDQSPIAMAIVGPDLRVQRPNAALQRLLGYEENELIGLLIADITHPDDLAHDLAALERVLNREIDSYQIQKRFIRSDGGVILGRLTASAVWDEQGEFQYGLGVIEDITAQAEAYATIQDQNDRLAMTLEAAGVATWELDLRGMRQTVSDNYASLLGLEPDEIPQTFDEVLALIHPDDHAMFLEPDPDPRAAGDRFKVEFRLVPRSGRTVWAEANGSFIRDAEGTPIVLRGTIVDLSSQREVEIRRIEAEERYRRIVEASNDAFIGMGEDGRISEWNVAAERIFGWPAEEAIGSPIEALVPTERRVRYADGLRGWQEAAIRGDELPDRWEMTGLHRDGHTFPAEISFVTVEEGGTTRLQAFVRDITERRAYELRLAEEAATDTLTRLPNRGVLMAKLDGGIRRLADTRATLAVLFIDVDRFKAVNDSLGHDAGDQLLVVLAERLQQAVRPGDTVARVGGDEFVVVCEDLADASGAERVAERVLIALGAPVDLAGRGHHVGVSIGIASVSDVSTTGEDVIRDADAAMYRAKQQGGDRFEVFGEALRSGSRALFELETELREAVEGDELVVHYQPIVTLSGEPVAVEALVRWRHPERGLIPPADFITLAEQTGLIVPIGARVLDAACAQLAEWRCQGPALARLQLSVNLSSRQITQPDVVEVVRDALARHQVPADALCLEITESMLMEDTASVAETLSALRGLGVKIAVDDFGTGYSSLLYLRRFPVDILKLDRGFVAGLGDDGPDQAIVASMVSLAHALGLVAVAEGVEDPRQLEALRALGCDLAQGFLWARPAAPGELWSS